MNTCGNCKHWYGCDNVEENHAHYCHEEYNDKQGARTTADASCPRFAAKEPEIPADLTRKGLLLCNQNGELLMQRIQLRTELDEARKVIEKVAAYWNNENARDYAVAWLKAHTEVEG